MFEENVVSILKILFTHFALVLRNETIKYVMKFKRIICLLKFILFRND